MPDRRLLLNRCKLMRKAMEPPSPVATAPTIIGL